MFFTAFWFLLVVAGLIAGAWAAINLPAGTAVAVAVGVIACWIAWGKLLSYIRGIRRHVVAHLGRDWHGGQVVAHVVRTSDRVDLQNALDRARENRADRRTLFGIKPFMTGAGLIATINGNATPVPLEWESYPRSLTAVTPCATNGLYLLRDGKIPFAAMIRSRDRRMGGHASRHQVELEVLARTRDAAQAALDNLLRHAREHSVYRGRIVSLERSEDVRESYAVKFHDLSPVDRDAIVLYPDVLAVIERNVLSPLRYADRLRRLGQPIRRGLLLHGPPGTGKTLVTRYLARATESFTVILLTGRQLSLIRESCHLARLLAPSLVVLEDFDLIASERRRNRHTTVLHELMDEMDGLGARAEVTFLLTTNRPDILEPALAARPGRVDQSVYFPLPDADQRRRLLALFGRQLDLSGLDLEPLLARTEGASPAFLQELVRRATLMAMERGDVADLPRLTAEDFDHALRELVESGGNLTRNLLGFRPGLSDSNALVATPARSAGHRK